MLVPRKVYSHHRSTGAKAAKSIEVRPTSEMHKVSYVRASFPSPETSYHIYIQCITDGQHWKQQTTAETRGAFMRSGLA